MAAVNFYYDFERKFSDDDDELIALCDSCYEALLDIGEEELQHAADGDSDAVCELCLDNEIDDILDQAKLEVLCGPSTD